MEDRIGKLEEEFWNYPVRGEKEWMKKSKECLHDLWEYTKRTNIRIIRIPEEERKNGAENLNK